MSSPKKRYDICAGRPYGDDKKHWIQVGRLTEWDDGGLSIELHTVPVGSWFDGKLSVFEQKEREQAQQRRPQRQAAQDDFGDDLPPF